MAVATKNRPTKKATKKATKRTAKGAARGARARTLSATHKKKLAEGRTLSATVTRYLEAINTPKRRGRKVSTESLVARLSREQDSFKAATGVEKVLAAQGVRDAKARLAATPTVTNVAGLEKEFVKIAKQFSAARGITYGAWRDSGVSAVVLKRAGIARTRTA